MTPDRLAASSRTPGTAECALKPPRSPIFFVVPIELHHLAEQRVEVLFKLRVVEAYGLFDERDRADFERDGRNGAELRGDIALRIPGLRLVVIEEAPVEIPLIAVLVRGAQVHLLNQRIAAIGREGESSGCAWARG